MPATIHDVARQAGVSISTVSRGMNGTSPVKSDKRDLVLQVAEELGYEPNPAALSLLGKKTGGIGVLLPFITDEFFSDLLGGLDAAAQEADRFLVISTSHLKVEEFRRAAKAFRQRVDGFVVMAPELKGAQAALMLGAGVPTVFINTQVEETLQADVFNFDNYGGMYRLTKHLIEQGHTDVVHVRGPESAWDASERARGYRDAMREAGLDAHMRFVQGNYTRQAGYESVAEILEMEPRPTAIVAANDYCATGVLSALHEAGIEVPGDISVCGFDGLASSQYTVPPLTTASVPIRQIGERAIRRLVGRLEERENVGAYALETAKVEVVDRQSAAPKS